MHVVVTGGSSGIGLAVAGLYARQGARLTLIGRDPQKLEKARAELAARMSGHAPPIHLASADIASEAEITAAIAAAAADLGPCEVLIAAAGIVAPGDFASQPAEAFAAQVNTNLLGTANTLRAVLPGMLERRSGRIMIVASGAALTGIWGYAAYCASKSALAALSEVLSLETEGTGVSISICFPPDTFTPQLEAELQSRPVQAQWLMGKARARSAESVARRIVAAVDRRQARVYFGFSLAALGLAGSLIRPPLLWCYRRRLRKHAAAALKAR